MSNFKLNLVRTVTDVKDNSKVDYYMPEIIDTTSGDEVSGQIEYKTALTPVEIVAISDQAIITEKYVKEVISEPVIKEIITK
jgi:hypothetical protein